MDGRRFIVGAGFGGIEAVKSLLRVPVEITVIDRQNHHCFQPLMRNVENRSTIPNAPSVLRASL